MNVIELPYSYSTPPDEYTGQLRATWDYQQARYELMWRYYTGAIWLETHQETGNRKYPIGTNDIALACNMHAQVLFGQVKDNGGSLLTFRVRPRKGFTVDDSLIGVAQDFLDELWGESSSRQIQYQAGVVSQVTGGVFWRVRYSLENANPFDLYPLKFEMLFPDYVYPVFAPGTTRLNEIFLRYKLPREAARTEFGVWSPTWSDMVEYREHWTGPIKGMPGMLSVKIGLDGDWKTIKAEQNPFGFVPFVYIPHIPGNGFYGIPLAEMAGATDLSEEYNTKLGEVGDIVRQNSYPFGVLRGHPNGTLRRPFRLWADGPAIVDLGVGLPGENSPELDWFNPSDVTRGTTDHMEALKKETRTMMAVPPIAVGEDEGSQRSSLTLVTRFFPMTSHVIAERWQWTPPMEQLCRMALQIAKLKMIGNLRDLDVRHISVTPQWAPMLPRDRLELTNEMVQRSSVGLVHPLQALEQFEDVPQGEIEQMFEDIKEYREWEAELNKPEETTPSEQSNANDAAD